MILGASLRNTLPTAMEQIPLSFFRRAVKLAAKICSRAKLGNLPLNKILQRLEIELDNFLPASNVTNKVRYFQVYGFDGSPKAIHDSICLVLF